MGLRQPFSELVPHHLLLVLLLVCWLLKAGKADDSCAALRRRLSHDFHAHHAPLPGKFFCSFEKFSDYTPNGAMDGHGKSVHETLKLFDDDLRV
jgi:hypothetical protein